MSEPLGVLNSLSNLNHNLVLSVSTMHCGYLCKSALLFKFYDAISKFCGKKWFGGGIPIFNLFLLELYFLRAVYSNISRMS